MKSNHEYTKNDLLPLPAVVVIAASANQIYQPQHYKLQNFLSEQPLGKLKALLDYRVIVIELLDTFRLQLCRKCLVNTRNQLDILLNLLCTITVVSAHVLLIFNARRRLRRAPMLVFDVLF